MTVYISDDELNLIRTDYFGDNILMGTLENINGSNVPFSEVKIFNQHNNVFICSVYSDEDGRYEKHNINLKQAKFFVIAHHQTGEFNGVIADNIGGADNVDD